MTQNKLLPSLYIIDKFFNLLWLKLQPNAEEEKELLKNIRHQKEKLLQKQEKKAPKRKEKEENMQEEQVG